MDPKTDRSFSFGKYKGRMLSEIMIEDPGYIVWVQENVDWFSIPKEVYEKAIARQELLRRPRRRRVFFDDDEEEDQFHYDSGYDPHY